MESKTMNFRDRYETDEEGNQFLFTVEMQRRLSEAGLPVEVAYLDQVQQAPPPPKPKPSPAPSQEKKRSEEDVTEPVSIQIDPMTGKYIGRIKWYNARKGYGFILRGDVEETNKGPEATDIEPYQGDESE
jgi:hypothetical protein